MVNHESVDNAGVGMVIGGVGVGVLRSASANTPSTVWEISRKLDVLIESVDSLRQGAVERSALGSRVWEYRCEPRFGHPWESAEARAKLKGFGDLSGGLRSGLRKRGLLRQRPALLSARSRRAEVIIAA